MKTNRCRYCHNEFESITEKMFCSPQCRHLYRRVIPIKTKICPHCKKPFETSREVKKYCSDRCQAAVRYKNKTKPCSWCGKIAVIYKEQNGKHYHPLCLRQKSSYEQTGYVKPKAV